MVDSHTSPTQKPTPNLLLRHERERRCWSQQELADKVGSTPLNVSRWERGINQPSPFFRQKLCQVFEKTPQELGLFVEPLEIKNPGVVPSPDATPQPAAKPAVTIWNVPFRRNPFFTGRDETLEALHAALILENSPIGIAQPQAISGLSGIGKTQTAVEYAYRYRGQYDAVFWVRAESYDLLVSDFQAIATLLNLPERDEQDQQKMVEAVKYWFDNNDNWLLILDNADTLDIVGDVLPSNGRGYILLTTRSQSTGTIAQRIELDTMSSEEGTLFLLRRAKRLRGATTLEGVDETVRKDAQAIVEAVDGLPLALDQAGAYIEETGCSLTDYLKFYKTRRNRLLRMRGRDATGHPEPVATTWSLSFDKVKRANPAAAELLQLCAFLHPDAIPETMLADGATELGPVLQAATEDPLELNDTLRELLNYSLIKRDADQQILNIHRLVQAVLKDALKPDEQKVWAERVVRMMSKAFPQTQKFDTWTTCQLYLPHALACIEVIEQWQLTFPEAPTLLSYVGEYLQERSLYAEAELILKKVLHMQEQTLDGEDPDVARTLHMIGKVYFFQGRFAEAEEMSKRALAIHEKVLGPEHIDVAVDLNDLAMYYNYQGKYTLTEHLYKRSLAIHEKVRGAEHQEVAGILSSMALLYQAQGRYEESEQYHQRALAIDEKIGGEDSPDVANDLNNLSILYQVQGKYAQVEQLRQKVLSIAEKAFGPDHLYVSISLINLASVYLELEQFDAAEPLAQRSLQIIHKIVGAEHAEAAYSLSCLALIQQHRKNYEQAEQLLMQVLSIREQTLGKENPFVAQTLYFLGKLYTEADKYEMAEGFLQRALTMRETILGSEHPDVAQVLHGLALLYGDQRRYEEAVSVFQRVLTIREQKLLSSHPLLVKTLIDYAALLRKTDREAEAAALEARAHR